MLLDLPIAQLAPVVLPTTQFFIVANDTVASRLPKTFRVLWLPLVTKATYDIIIDGAIGRTPNRINF